MFLIPVCHYYQLGCCRNGDNCSFLHPVTECESFSNFGSCVYGTHCHFWHNPNRTRAAKTPVCHFHLMGACKYGDRCNLSHDVSEQQQNEATGRTLSEYQAARHRSRTNHVASSTDASYDQYTPSPFQNGVQQTDPVNASVARSPQEVLPYQRPVSSRPTTIGIHSFVSNISEPDPGIIAQLQNSDIDRLTKLHPPSRLHEEVCFDGRLFLLKFASSDPDWAYDVKDINIGLMFPPLYPSDPLRVTVQDQTSLPRQLIEHFNDSIREWIVKKHEEFVRIDRAEPYVRSFLFWLDRNLEKMFKEGLVKMQSNPQPLPTPGPDQSSDSSHDVQSTNQQNDQSLSDQLSHTSLTTSPPATDSQAHNIGRPSVALALSDLHLLGDCGTVRLRKLGVAGHCSRCRQAFDWQFSLPGDQSSSTSCCCLPPHESTCDRCKQPLGLWLKASLGHQAERRVGSMGTSNCVIDYVLDTKTSSEALLSCIQCNTLIKVAPLTTGHKINKRCHQCNALVGLQFSAFDLQRLTESDGSSSTAGKRPVDSKPKCLNVGRTDPLQSLIRDGQPLPEKGACKHYRHSYRWLKFPCCGRLAPCDKCHDEAGGVEKHEIQMATRMLCGYCAKEQPWSNTKPCLRCGRDLTSQKSSAAFWEGGKGCRNPVTMSRKDDKKYSSMSKTVPAARRKTGK